MEMIEKIIDAWKRLLGVCDGAISRDEQGFSLFDAFNMRLYYRSDLFGVERITPEEVEFLRRKLLKYRKQLKELGYRYFDVLDRSVHEISFFAVGENWEGQIYRISINSIRNHLPFIYELLNTDGIRIYAKFGKDSLVKWILVRLNDIDINGNTVISWEDWW